MSLRAVFGGKASTATITTSAGTSPPAAGALGEIISNNQPSGSAVALTTATSANVISVSVTAGEWNVWGTITFNLAAASSTILSGSGSATSATMNTQPGTGGYGADALFTEDIPTTTLTGLISRNFSSFVRISSTTTMFLVANATFSVGTISAYGSINFRRVA
jgi:hypothetical protein